MKQLQDRLFAIDLCSQYNIDMILFNSACYIICDNVDDQNKIKSLATFLHKEGVREINLFGKHKEVWQAILTKWISNQLVFQNCQQWCFATLLPQFCMKILKNLAMQSQQANDLAMRISFLMTKHCLTKLLQNKTKKQIIK